MPQNSTTKEVVTVDPSEEGTDPQAVANTHISTAQSADLVNLYCISTATTAVLPSADTKTSSEIYALDAPGISNAKLKDRLTGAYPDSYLVQIEPIHGFDPNSIGGKNKSGTLAAVEYKAIGANWTEDTLLPFAPAVETSQTTQLGVRHRSPLANAFSVLERDECAAVYHVAIRATDHTTNDLKKIKQMYENGPRSAQKILADGIDKLDDSSDSDTEESSEESSDTETGAASASYATDIGCITQGMVVEIDPRFVLYGSEATKQARALTNAFRSMNISACRVDGKLCRGRRARQSHARAFKSPSGLGPWFRSKLRSPQCRLPAIKRLTRNQSTRFVVSEYALPHFISMEATTEGDTGGLDITRRPPTAPPEPPN